MFGGEREEKRERKRKGEKESGEKKKENKTIRANSRGLRKEKKTFTFSSYVLSRMARTRMGKIVKMCEFLTQFSLFRGIPRWQEFSLDEKKKINSSVDSKWNRERKSSLQKKKHSFFSSNTLF